MIDHIQGSIRIGHKVFLMDGQCIGLTTKLFLDHDGQLSYLATRTSRLFRQHKMVPVAAVIDVSPLRVQLSINWNQFMKLSGYRTDIDIAEEVDRAIWNDVELRGTDYQGIDVLVRDGVVTLNGHVVTSTNQSRAETAVKSIPGILGVKNHLIADHP